MTAPDGKGWIEGRNFLGVVILAWLGAGIPIVAEEGTRITAVRNQVTQGTGESNQPTDVGHAVASGEIVSTGDQGLVEIKSGQATTVRAGEKSRVAYDAESRTLKLEKGTVMVDASPEDGPVKIDLGGAAYVITSEESPRAKTAPHTASASGTKPAKKDGDSPVTNSITKTNTPK